MHIIYECESSEHFHFHEIYITYTRTTIIFGPMALFSHLYYWELIYITQLQRKTLNIPVRYLHQLVLAWIKWTYLSKKYFIGNWMFEHFVIYKCMTTKTKSYYTNWFNNNKEKEQTNRKHIDKCIAPLYITLWCWS